MLGQGSREKKDGLKEPMFTSLLRVPGCILNNSINMTLPFTFQNLYRNSIVQIVLACKGCFFIFFGRTLQHADRPGIEAAPPTLEAWSLNHWTSREVPSCPNNNRIYRVWFTLGFTFFWA